MSVACFIVLDDFLSGSNQLLLKGNWLQDLHLAAPTQNYTVTDFVLQQGQAFYFVQKK
ncbi:MAG: hypothetical protein IPM53_05805 [Anaerolineaceae bacterium]|nr:hypothetical protein [Anaerolineaceae bacterium]